MNLYAASSDVIALYDAEGYALLLNLRTGQVAIVNPPMGYVWKELERGLELRDATQALLDRKGRAPADHEIQELLRLGMLGEGRRASRTFAEKLISTKPSPAARTSPTDERVSASYTLAAWVGFAIAMVVVHLPVPFSARLGVIRVFTRIRRQRPTLESTIRLVGAVRRVAEQYPGWSDCYEISLGAFLAAALRGEAPSWCVGARFGPLEQHAWLEVESTAVDHSPVEDGRRYEAMVRITPAR